MSDAEIMASAGIADAALQMAGSITASAFNYRHTKELAQWQNDMNVANWKMANEYNTPANQMKRFEEAGLNPNLMYGQGNPGNAGTVAAASAGSHNEVRNPFAGISLAGAYQNVKNAALQGESVAISNDEKKIRLFMQMQDINAWQQFSYDHIDKSKFDPDFPTLFSYDKGGIKTITNEGYYSEYIRNSPQYKKLELLWQKGELNEHNIGLIDSRKLLTEGQTGVLGFNEEKNQLLKQVMQGDLSGDNFKKLITLLLINLLESSTSPGVLGKFF